MRHLLSRLRNQVSRRTAALACVTALGAASAGLSGCNDATAGSLLGAGIGALAGQAIGHNTESTLIGGAVGAGAGYIIGNESDKAKHNRYYHGHHHQHGRYSY